MSTLEDTSIYFDAPIEDIATADALMLPEPTSTFRVRSYLSVTNRQLIALLRMYLYQLLPVKRFWFAVELEGECWTFLHLTSVVDDHVLTHEIISGKSSLLLLFQRFLSPRTGNICIDGIDTSTASSTALRNRIIALPQVPFFLPDGHTLRENLEFHGQDAPFGPVDNDEFMMPQDDECRYALEAVGLWPLFASKGGRDAELRDSALSRGQKQLFSLARAIVRARLAGSPAASPSEAGSGGLLLLDEFNTGLDSETERKMWALLMREFANYTILCAAHKLEAVNSCDKVIIMRNGRVAQVGRPQEVYIT